MTDDLRFVRDFILQNTYFKSDLLDDAHKPDTSEPLGFSSNPFAIYDDHAPERRPRAWHRAPLCSLPTDLPSVLGSIEDLIAGRVKARALSPLQRLATILRFSASPLRWEPLNNCSTHRAIPSPRYLFSCDAYFLQRSGETIEAYRYHPDEHALELINSNAAPSLLGDGTMAFCVVGDVGRCARPYGNFALSLVTPEAGLLSAQLGLMCAAVGWGAKIAASFSEYEARNAFDLQVWSRLPLAIVRIDTQDGALPLIPRPEPRTIRMRSDDPLELEPLTPLRCFIEQCAATPAQPHPSRIASRPRYESVDDAIEFSDLADALRQRGSGVLVGGLAPIRAPITLTLLRSLAVECRSLASLQSENELSAVFLSFIATTLAEDGIGTGQYRINLATGEVAQVTQENHARRLREAFSLVANLKEMGIAVTISTDQVAAVRIFGRRAFFYVQLAAGMWLQFLSLACARRGLFLRPMRSYAERGIEAMLPPDQQIVFQCLIGRSRRANIQYDIG